MHGPSGVRSRRLGRFGVAALLAAVATAVLTVGTTQAGSGARKVGPFKAVVTEAAAFDVSKPLRELAKNATVSKVSRMPAERGPVVADHGHAADGALQGSAPQPTIPSPLVNFEGLSNQDNFDVYGFRVNPPDPNGEVGPNHYVEMINLVFAVYDKLGNKLLGPVPIGALWEGFKIPDCTDPSGDPIVIYDQFTDHWILTQFTTSGFNDPTKPFWNCVAVSKTGDPTGEYFRYAFETTFDGIFYFPDYPKYSVWRDSYLLTSRDFGPTDEYGISVYALEKNKMIKGKPNARAVHFFLDSDKVPIYLIGDGLLPADVDGPHHPRAGAAAPIVGTMDDEGPYGAPFDALNIWDLKVDWGPTVNASLNLATQLPVAEFDSAYPCSPGSRDCLPQPGITNRDQYIDILSYRQRPTFRLAYRRFIGGEETMVTNQSVEARPDVAGVRWYEIHRNGSTYSLFQQGTYAPADGVHRWMGSIAMDHVGNMGLGYSVVNGTDVFPGIRYTGRLRSDPPGQMTLGEGVIATGTGVQTTTNSRWGDYTDMTVDPVGDCTFWYVNEYYTLAGQQSSPAGWQTRIASFRLPGCFTG